jgi:hypothetical protein
MLISDGLQKRKFKVIKQEKKLILDKQRTTRESKPIQQKKN